MPWIDEVVLANLDDDGKHNVTPLNWGFVSLGSIATPDLSYVPFHTREVPRISTSTTTRFATIV